MTQNPSKRQTAGSEASPVHGEEIDRQAVRALATDVVDVTENSRLSKYDISMVLLVIAAEYYEQCHFKRDYARFIDAAKGAKTADKVSEQ